MKKQYVFLLVFAVVIAGSVFAENSGFGKAGAANSFGFDLSQTYGINSDLRLDLMADGPQKAPIGGIGPVAGLMNMPLGLWSWLHKDWLGGGITAGLAAAGVILIVVGNNEASNAEGNTDSSLYTGFGKSLVGLGLIGLSPVFGFVRGWMQFNKLKAASVAEAIDDNPLNHIQLTAFPTFDERTAVGSVTYSMSF